MILHDATDDGAVELLSPLPLERCRRRLEAQVDREWAVFGNRPLVGRLELTTLRARKRISYANSFQTRVTATLSAQGQTTLVSCRFAVFPVVKVVMVVWFAGVASLGGVSMFAGLAAIMTDGRAAPTGSWMAILVPAVMLAGGVGMVRLGRHLARDERDELLSLLCDTLQATRRT